MTVVSQDDVRGFEIAIDNWRIESMKIDERIEDLVGDIEYQSFIEPTTGRREFFLERSAGHVLHNQIVMVVFIKPVENPRDVLIFELGQQICLSVKSHDSSLLLIRSREPVDHLGKSALAGNSMVSNQINLFHGSATKQANDLIAVTKHDAGSKDHRSVTPKLPFVHLLALIQAKSFIR